MVLSGWERTRAWPSHSCRAAGCSWQVPALHLPHSLACMMQITYVGWKCLRICACQLALLYFTCHILHMCACICQTLHMYACMCTLASNHHPVCIAPPEAKIAPACKASAMPKQRCLCRGLIQPSTMVHDEEDCVSIQLDTLFARHVYLSFLDWIMMIQRTL